MSRIFAFAVVATALLTADPAQSDPAKFPVPWFSTADPVLIGSPLGTHAYRVVLRTMDNLPSIGREVVLDFSATTIRLSTNQEAGVTLNCAHAPSRR